jgi:hypothetical protein
VGLAQVQFVASNAVVQSNRRDGLGAVTVKITGKNDARCLGHVLKFARHGSDEPLTHIHTATIDPDALAAIDQRVAARALGTRLSRRRVTQPGALQIRQNGTGWQQKDCRKWPRRSANRRPPHYAACWCERSFYGDLAEARAVDLRYFEDSSITGTSAICAPASGGQDDVLGGVMCAPNGTSAMPQSDVTTAHLGRSSAPTGSDRL